MIGPTSIRRTKFFVLLLWLAALARALAAPDNVRWNFIGLPATGTTGQTITFSASVTNTGADDWSDNYFLELRNEEGAHLDYGDVDSTRRGETTLTEFTLTLPLQPGDYTYHFTALHHGRAYFGPLLARTISVRRPPLDVSLDLDATAIFVGQRATARSIAGPSDEVAVHALEVRPLGGRWQTWAEWADRLGDHVASTQPPTAGIYEIRAYAARDDEEELTYSSRALLTVAAIPPAIVTQPLDVIVNVGETVTLAVTASGTEPEFQWRKEGVALRGATSPTFTLSAARVVESGSYDVTVSNSAGSIVSRAARVLISPLSLPALGVEVSHFPASGGKRSVPLNAATVGDVVSLSSSANVTAGAGWHHNLLIRRPAITAGTALAPEDGSGFTEAHEAWNTDGWGNPHLDGGSYTAQVLGHAASDLGNREPFVHVLAAGQTSSTRATDLVLDAPGTWLLRSEILDGGGQLIATTATIALNVNAPVLAGDVANMTYPCGRSDRFVGVFWNAGQAHRLWSTWRAEFQSAYRPTWAVNWKLMWQPSPYFRNSGGGWFDPSPEPESPWQSFWAGHQVYALVPDGNGGSQLTHDLTSQAFAEKAALRLMDVGVDFVAVDYTNQFLEEREDVLPALNHLAQAFQAVALRSQSGQRVKLTAVVPGNITSGDWAANGGFAPRALARFSAKLSTLHTLFASSPAAWFDLEDDDGARKPLLLVWIGAGGEADPDGRLPRARLDQMVLADGRRMADVFTLRWVGAYLSGNYRFLTGASYAVDTAEGAVTGRYAKAKTWSYHERFPSAAAIMPGATGPTPAVEAITVQPLADGLDRFGRAWQTNWPADEGYHYETPATRGPVPLGGYGRTWRQALAAARALNPKFILTTWAEFGSENDEPRPELSVTVMDNNKFGTHFGDALKETVRQFKYREPTAWIDTVALGEPAQWIHELSFDAVPPLRSDQSLRLQGWVSPNVATTFAGGSVKIYVDDELRGAAVVGGAWNGATRWYYDLSGATLRPGSHAVKVLADDGVGGTALAGLQFRGAPPRNVLPIVVTSAAPGR